MDEEHVHTVSAQVMMRLLDYETYLVRVCCSEGEMVLTVNWTDEAIWLSVGGTNTMLTFENGEVSKSTL